MRKKYKLGILLVIIIAIIAARISTVLLLRASGISVDLSSQNTGY
jgi:hypothetical protein